MSEFEGHENLETVSNSENFNNWMYEEIFPGLKGDILEIGSGQGAYSKRVIRDFPESKITLTEISTSYLENLKRDFSSNNVNVAKLDLNNKKDFENIGYEKFDSIFGLNVLEHVEDDIFALNQLFKMLKNDGNLIILVPCYKFLFNVIDENVGHWRRYTKKELESKLQKTNFDLQKIFSFNFLGIIGWYINGNICKNPQINPKATKVFDKIIPIEKHLEKIFGKKIGLSIITISKKHVTNDVNTIQ